MTRQCRSTVRNLVVLAAAACALTLRVVAAATVSFKNQCDYPINVYDNWSLCPLQAMTNVTGPVYGCDRALPDKTMYRHERDPQATLAEFAYGSGKVWYDISIIPPNPKECSSLDGCRQSTGLAGFNVGVMIYPTIHRDATERCRRIMCQYDRCPDAFHFPADTTKVYNCPEDEHFEVIFCP